MPHHRIVIDVKDEYARAVAVNLDTGARRTYVTNPLSNYQDGPKWSARDEMLGDFWAAVRDTYDTV